MQRHPTPKPNGDTVLDYLFNATRVTKKLIDENTWSCAIPKHHNKSSKQKTKKHKADNNIAAFPASAKKMKQDEARARSQNQITSKYNYSA
ncbi:predicted protein [Chaetoceros tenuissimus]|uniref:Uncharacterized protein n=1 Tax=Chaetoceros tenuissimus TaxID=426638 RepID=A0AAD3D0V8_9STRA|nr:predicted protein [Chaetoceros tenuissimus]